MPSTYDQKVQELRSLDEQLASTPESFGEYVERRKVEDARSLGDKSSAFLDSFMVGGKALAQEGASAIGELFSGDVGTDELGGVYEVGKTDFVRFAKTIGGSVMDNIYSDENEMQREYQRYVDNFLYNQEVRPAMLNTYDEEGRDFVSFGANFVDPSLLVPAAGLIAKGGALGAKAVATGAKAVSKGAKAGAFAARSPRLVQLSRAMAKTSRGAEMVAKGGIKVASGLNKASEIASIPSQIFAKGTRGVLKGTAKAGQLAARATGKAGEITSKVAGAPRSVITKIASSAVDPKVAGSGILGAQVVAAGTGAIPGLGILTATEGLGYIANKTGRGMERVLGALSSSGGQKRFLQRLATSADSKAVRRAALFAHRYGGTRLGDTAFNMLANGATVGTLNAALAYAAGEGPEGVGAAAGSGALIGGSLPFGQSGMRGGKTQLARDETSIGNYLDAKLADEQKKQFVKLSPVAKLAFATVEEAGIKAPKIEFLDGKTYLELLRQNDPNLRSAPEANLDMDSNVITVNQDGSFAKSSELALDILLHELGHGFIKQGIKDDPFFASKILKEYQPKKGEESFEFAFTSDSAGSPIDSIQVNTNAKEIAKVYDGIQKGISIGRDANSLAQEIGAEQFAMMMVDNGGNLFKTIEPSLRHKLLDASKKVLGIFGMVDQLTGNPLSISILGKKVKDKNPILQRSKAVRNLYKNYVLQKEKALVDKIDLAENPMSLKLDKGENAQQAVQRLFSSKGLSLKEAGAFRIKNRQIKRKLIQIRDRLFEKPEGGMRAETNKKGKPVYIVGKKLTDELKAIFTRNDPFGNINTLINIATEAIMQKAQMTMLYRAGKPSKYSDNELRPRVIAPVRYKVTGLANSAKSFASLKLDAFDEAYLRNNAEVLVAEDLAKDPNKLVELARQVARDAMNDPEGRINPEGKYENEIVTALFGQPESAPQIRNPKIRRLLEEGRLKEAYRTYDIDGLAGLVPTGKSGISFDWHNVKNNYLPTEQTLFMPRQSKNYDKKVALRTNDSLIELVDKIANEEGVSRNDVLNRILQEKFSPEEIKTPDSEIVPPSPGKESQNLSEPTLKKYWSEDSDQDLNWLQNDPSKKLFMPAETVDRNVRRANKYARQFKDARKNDKVIIKEAREEWRDLGFESENFQEFMRGNETGIPPVLADEKAGNYIPKKMYYTGQIGIPQGANYDRSIDVVKMVRDKVDNRESHRWNPDETIILTQDRKRAREIQKEIDPEHIPLVMATNAKYIFDVTNPEHLRVLKNHISEIPNKQISSEKEMLVQRPGMINPDIITKDAEFDYKPTDLPTDYSNVNLFENELKSNGWHGYKFTDSKGEHFAIFDSRRVKLIEDQSAESKVYSKDRPFGKVSGLFGKQIPSDRMSSVPKRDIRFMPQMELDFDGKSKTTRPTEQPSQGISFWKLFGIDKNDKQVYKKVAEKLINTGSPDMDPQTALDYGPRLGMDVKRLRQEMRLAQKRNSSSGKYFLPKLPTYKKDGKTFKIPLPPTSPDAPRAYHGSKKKYDYPDEKYLGDFTKNLGYIGMGYYGHPKRIDAEMYAISESKSLYSFEMLPEGQTMDSHLPVGEQHPSIQKNLTKLFETKVSGTGQNLKDLWAKFYTENPTRYVDEMLRSDNDIYGGQINPEINKNIGNKIYMGLVNLYSKNPVEKVGYLANSPDNIAAASTVNKILAKNNIKGAISSPHEGPGGRQVSPEVVVFDFNEIRDFRSEGNKLFMPNDRDYMYTSGGIILPDGSFIKADTGHKIDLFDWVENNPKNPFAQKMKRAEKFHDERYGEEKGFNVLEAGLNAGAIRVARDPYNPKIIYIESSREIPSRLRRELIDQAMMTGNTLIRDRGSREQIIFQPENKLFMPTETFEGSPGSFFRKKSSRDTSAQVRTFKSPVYLKDGSRLSGVADNPEQNPFYGYDKNGQEFSQRREYVNPQDITKSRDSDRTANQIRNELESGQKLFMPASEAGATKGKQPANRIQQQAPAMPGNRFMAPAASAGAKLSERFR
jgi:hypothetical protein